MDLVNCFDCYPMVPEEIFIRIFRLLLLDDRKSIRLTCRRFYKLCDDSLIQSAEVIALRGTFNTVPWLQCLSRSSRRIQNIKLSRMHLTTETVLPFFKQQGSHLRSLNLINCSFDRGTLKVMIEHCGHLRHLAVACILIDYEIVLKDLQDLVRNSIVRDCVTDLSLALSLTDSSTNQNILHFFAVFPSISKLNLDIRTGGRVLCETFVTNSIMSSGVASCLLAIADQLKDINRFSVDGVPDGFSNMKNLEQLSLSGLKNLPDIPVMFQSAKFERLTHVRIDRLEFESKYPFVQRLLQFAALQSLDIAGCAGMVRQLFKSLVESKLRTLKIRCICSRDDSLLTDALDITDSSSSMNTLMPNYCLQHLAIGACDNNLTLLFAYYFRSVNQLRLPKFNEYVLQNILNDRATIRSLHLSSSANLSFSKELFNFQYYLRKASTVNRELRYLTELIIAGDRYSLAYFLLSEFVFPKLKKLTIILKCGPDEHDVDNLLPLILKLPQLQSLNLYVPSVMTYSQWLTVCKSSTKLHHFHVLNCGHFFTSSKYVQLFDVSPSLRRITHREWPVKASTEKRHKYLIYDVIKKTVVDSPKEPNLKDDGDFWTVRGEF